MVWGDHERTKKIRELVNGALISANRRYKNSLRTSNNELLLSADGELAIELRKIADTVEKHNI